MSLITNVKKRNNQIVEFEIQKIEDAICKAFVQVTREEKREVAHHISEIVLKELELEAMNHDAYVPTVEHTQDLVEKHLMAANFFDVAKHYIIYRYEHTKIREEKKAEDLEKLEESALKVTKRDGKLQGFSEKKIRKFLAHFTHGHEAEINIDQIVNQIKLEAFDGMSTKDISKSITMIISSMIELDPAYSTFASRLLLRDIYIEATGTPDLDFKNIDKELRESFVKNIAFGIEKNYLAPEMANFDLEEIAKHMDYTRDDAMMYMGTETLYERYFVRDTHDTRRILEDLQGFWMRIAMGLALGEKMEDRTVRAVEFYDVMSTMRFMPSSPTLFHAGTHHAQLSSCYLNTVGDSLESIFKVYADNAQLSKWAGGIGTNWTNVRASGALVKGSGIKSNGIVPFLKVANDVTVAINRSGRRRGATCVYLENWHYDVEEFLDLRKNTGDDRRRTHDMNTALWISDTFMKRVRDDADWLLFSPDEVPMLLETYGAVFESHYIAYEAMANDGRIKLFKKMKARDMWRKMVTMLYETGHPWITFKDPSNVRSPQDHAGIVHNSNLCTEITLNNSLEETAVCNLGSFNYALHIEDGKLNEIKVKETIYTAMRMLDNVIDINYYPTAEAKNSNMKHRPVGLGVMGFHDALYKLNINFDSEAAVVFADESMEVIAYNAIMASSLLAKDRGAYSSFKGSKWDRNLLPQDTVKLLEESRGENIDVSKSGRLDWTPVRESIKSYGMRNSNCMAIAPTATISNIVGTIPCIEPIYKNIFVKANMNGDFIVVNPYLHADLKARGLWDYEMIGLLKYNDGSVKNIASVPQDLKDKYKEVFEIDPKWLIRTAAYRGKWIDQSQSLNIYYSGTSGKELATIYEYAWKMGLKTTYYLRSLGASQVEKSTVNTAEFGSTHKRDNTSNVTAMPISGITDIKMATGMVSPLSVLPSVDTISASVATVVASAPVAYAVNSSAVTAPIASPSMSKPLEIPADAPKKIYNITRAPEATCDGCQ
jgi:ribonucleoside-diphosphate reductase alpha chain